MLKNLFDEDLVIVNLHAATGEGAIRELLKCICKKHPHVKTEEALAALLSREKCMSTGIMRGIAIPHASCDSIDGTAVAIGMSERGIQYGSLDGSPVHFVMLVLFEEGFAHAHLKIMKEAAELMMHHDFLKTMLAQKTAHDVCRALLSFEETEDDNA